jgi:cytochrome d ubiquinol oxidase subunit I
MLLVSWAASFYLFYKNNLNKFLAYILVAMTFSGVIAVLAGWYVTEIGRQPWLVTGILKTRDALSNVPSNHIIFTLSIYLALYLFLGFAYIRTIFYLAKNFGKSKKEPEHD